MKVLFYANSNSNTEKKIHDMLTRSISRTKLEVYRKLESFVQRLRRSTRDLDVSVILAGTQKELSDILSIRKQLLDLRIVLILPDREKATITQGHTLYPRFLSYTDSNLNDLQAVLYKMIGPAKLSLRSAERNDCSDKKNTRKY